MTELNWELCNVEHDDDGEITFKFNDCTHSLGEFERTTNNPWGNRPDLAALGIDAILPTSTGTAIVLQVADSNDPDLDDKIWAAHYTAGD